jgi:geranylgeranyl reductase family protein
VTTFDADVAVVGGGPAGSAAATLLARKGRRVVVVDRATFPRDKCCGDGLTAWALRRLESLGLRPAAVRSWQQVGTVSVRSPSGRVADFALPDGGVFAAAARRSDLDTSLLELAEAAGATVMDGHPLLGAKIAAGSLKLSIDGLGEISVPWAIGADGAWSPLRRSIEGGGYRGEWHAQRQYFCDVSGPAAARMLVWFERELLPGYAWSFPLAGGRANVGLGLRRGPGRSTGEVRGLWRALLERPHVREALGGAASPESPPRSWPIPTSLERRRLSAAGGRILFAGDAARVGDPMTGEGIGQALETGLLAAGAVLASAAPEEARRRYGRSVSAALGVDNLVSSALSAALRSEAAARGSLRIVGHSSWTRARFARWLMEDYPRGLLLTPSRWARGAMSRPGAYSGPAAWAAL